MTLFDMPVEIRSTDDESPTQRLTRRNKEQLANGIHPATHRKLREPRDATCADCVHSARLNWHDHWFWKCSKHRLGFSHSSASDIRKSWPACVLFERDPS